MMFLTETKCFIYIKLENLVVYKLILVTHGGKIRTVKTR